MPFIPITDEEQQEMLKRIGMNFEDFIESIPEEIRIKSRFNLAPPLSEMGVTKLLKEIASKNKAQDYIYFLGGGAYDHYIPSVINHILIRPEFYTAYTPYQPEVSQGTLQSIFEYQSMICDLTGMDVTNASMYDGATALAEAIHMARNITGKNRAIISPTIHPYYQRVIKTYTEGMDIPLIYPESSNGKVSIDSIEKHIDDDTACVVVQHPNFFGILEDVEEISDIAHRHNTFFNVSYNPISLGILKAPDEYGADIATGEGQPLGLPLSFGGPYLGLFSAKKEFIRKMPGRIIGHTVDKNGKKGFVMTLQTREQHIRRGQATSNICTNNGLCALAGVVYLAIMGKNGIYEVANQCAQKAHYLKKELQDKGAEFPFNAPFFNEFVLKTKIDTASFVKKMIERGILPGIPLEKFNPNWKNYLLVSVTEKRSKEEINKYIEEYSKIG